jgi:hypothetical protein
MTKELTPWFPAGIKPKRNGVYRTRTNASSGYSLWVSGKWAWQCRTPDEAQEDGVSYGTTGATQDKEWRGLATKPEGKA